MSRSAASRQFARNHLVVLSLGFAFLVLVPGCSLPLFTATETISEVFESGDAPSIVVETFNGSIDISDSGDDEVVVEIIKHASGFDQRTAEEKLDNIEVSLVQDANEIRVTVRLVEHSFGNCGASVIIAAPKGAKVNLKSSNAYIVSEGMQGGIDAQTSNGKIGIYKGRGPIKADTNNGRIKIEATDAIVDANTSNGRIHFQGTLAEDENNFETSNGRIEVILPEDSEFRFQASTSNGSIDCKFPYESDRSKSRRKKSGTVGDNPRYSLSLSTSNGSIEIRRDD